MRRIVINMQNTLFCNAIADTLRRSGNELETYTVDSTDKVVDECKWIAPYALLFVSGFCVVATTVIGKNKSSAK